jgi:hypothetical protein
MGHGERSAETDREFLRSLTQATIQSALVDPEEEIVGTHEGRRIKVANTLGFTAVRPAGLSAYPAIWTQDFTMTYSSGLVATEVGLAHLRLIASLQSGSVERRLPSSAVIPPLAVPDHINLDGTAVFFPGTYASGPDQGGEPWGICPPLNNYFDFIWLAYMLWQDMADGAFFGEQIGELTLMERITAAYAAPPAEEVTGAVYTTPERRAVGFIFCDSVYMTGLLLMPTLERYRAASQLSHIQDSLGARDAARKYARDAEAIRMHVERVFCREDDPCGWLRAATGRSGQPDVWGTIYALYLDILSPAARQRAVEQVVQDLDAGRINFEGALRHVPLGRDASARSAWEMSVTEHNRYQNGAFWHTPVGWLIDVLEREHPDQAAALRRDYMSHLREHDFRKGQPCGAPWECIGWEGQANQNPAFAASVALPYGVLYGRRGALP